MLDAIAAWELDSALEAPQRYLLRTAAIDAIAAGRASVVVGARGAGKTAAARAIVADSSRDRPAVRIGLKDAFLAALRPLTAPEQEPLASAFARYLLLLAALEAMVSEKMLAGSEIRELAREFAVTLDPSLAEALPLAYSKTLLYEVFGDRAAPAPVRGTVVERITHLEAALGKALKESRAFVLFDEAVDRSVVAGAFDALRVDALRTLMLGVAELARGPARERVVPVLFTRPGLFSRLPKHEQDFWGDRRLDLTWTSRELKAAAGHRLARAADPAATPKAAAQALSRFLSGGGRGFWPSEEAGWELVWSLSRARPRDMVFFLRAAARNCRHRGTDAVDAQALQQARKTYAAYLRQDMADEIRDAAPDVEELMDAIARHGKQRLSAPELVEVIERVLDSQGVEATAGTQDALERFFQASAIGNWVSEGRGGHDVFVHDDPAARLDYTAPVVIHPGLASALELPGERAA